MAKMWAGRTAGVTDPVADDFNSSIRFDSRMYREDITGSMAHAAMLGAQHILPQADADAIIDALQGILDDLDSGALAFDPACEDIHMFVARYRPDAGCRQAHERLTHRLLRARRHDV